MPPGKPFEKLASKNVPGLVRDLVPLAESLEIPDQARNDVSRTTRNFSSEERHKSLFLHK